MVISNFKKTLFLAATLGTTTQVHGACDTSPTNWLTNNTTNSLAASSVDFCGQTFTNKGLVGVGTFESGLTDSFGDTLGSFSALALDLTNWRKSGDTYTGGILLGVPDRGYNSGTFYSDFAARINRFSISLTPDTGTGPAASNSLTLNYLGSQKLKDNRGEDFTGLDPAANVSTALGANVPLVQSVNKIAIDAEGIAYLKDGSFYVSDEYAANIYYFGADRQLRGIINPVAAITPQTNNQINFNSTVEPNTGGRRNNQGLEGATVTPDGKKLVVLLQSATVQDSTNAQETRQNTRMLVYDIANNPTPSNPSAEYVLTLPKIDRDGTGPNYDRTAAQSEILSLNNSQFLVLSRDGNGLGNGDTRAAVFKSVLLVDTSNATNLAGSVYENSYTPIAPNGVLRSDITPVAQTELVNMLNPTQLSRFGVNLPNPVAAANTPRLAEKWESLGLAPALDPSAPNDYFLFVGNDNDFGTANGVMQGNAYSADYTIPNQILTYRLTLPTYVDPTYLRSMETLGRGNLNALRRSGTGSLIAMDDALTGFWAAENLRSRFGFDEGIRGFVQSNYQHLQSDQQNGFSGIFGFEMPIQKWLRFGMSMQSGAAWMNHAAGNFDNNMYGYGMHFRMLGDGWLARISASRNELNYDNIKRNDPYEMTAQGKTEGATSSIGLEIGLPILTGSQSWFPYTGYEWLSNRVDGYTETGSAGGDIRYGTSTERSERAFFGVQWGRILTAADTNDWSIWQPVLRVSYSHAIHNDGKTASLKLAHVDHVDASQNVGLSNTINSAMNIQAQLVRNLTASSQISLGFNTSQSLNENFSSYGANLRYSLAF
jgi:uncharacterized protein YhjY with autotransporter beta-barrel domain